MISERTFIISLSIKYRLWKYVAFVIPSFGAAHMVIICTGKQRVGIIAFDGPDKIWMVSQYRKAIDKVTLEIPAGLVDPGELPIETAKRELQEEVGYFPEKVTYLFDMHASPGFTNDKLSFFVAEDLVESSLDLDEDENLTSRSYLVTDLYQMVENGEITDAKSIIAIFYALRRINEA